MPLVTRESLLEAAASLDEGPARDKIISHLQNQEYALALVVCGEAILETLKRETDLSVDELKLRMMHCKRLEALEKQLSCFTKQQRQLARQRNGRGAPPVVKKHPASERQITKF